MHLNSGPAQDATVRPLPPPPELWPWTPDSSCTRVGSLVPMVTVSACLLGAHHCHLLPSGGSSWSSGGPAPTGGLQLERVGARGTLSGSQGCVLRHRSRQWVSPCPGPPGRELETQAPRRLSPYCGQGSGPASPWGVRSSHGSLPACPLWVHSPLCVGLTDDSPQLMTPAVALVWRCGVTP